MNGIIVSITDDVLKFLYAGSSERFIPVAPTCRITLDGEPAKLSDLPPKCHAVISGVPAVSIDARST